jgi:hypothetical protein
MKAIHGGKAKNDKIDAHKIAVRFRGGMLPQASVYPAEMRATRDVLRRRNTSPASSATMATAKPSRSWPISERVRCMTC